MPETIIRTAAAGDIPAITAIYAEAVLNGTATFEVDPPDEAEMGRRLAALRQGGFPYLVAVRSKLVVGYAYAGPFRTRPAYRYTVEDSIYLDKDHRGDGIGGAILAHLVKQATAQGFRQMIAVIGDSENLASIRLHRGAGFRPAGVYEGVGFKFGRWIDSVQMQRGLGIGAKSPPEP